MIIDEVEDMGGMTKAVESGCPSCASKRPRHCNRRVSIAVKQVIVGVNKYQLAEEPEVDVLDIDNSAVRESQIARLTKSACRTRIQMPASRPSPRSRRLLKPVRAICLTGCGCGSGPGYRRRDSVMLWRQEWGRHRPRADPLVVFMASAYQGDEGFMNIKKGRSICRNHGRRPRMLVVKWVRTAMTAVPRLLPRPLPTWALMWMLGPCFRPQKRLRASD